MAKNRQQRLNWWPDDGTKGRHVNVESSSGFLGLPSQMQGGKKLITCHSYLPMIPMIDKERKMEKEWLEYLRYLP